MGEAHAGDGEVLSHTRAAGPLGGKVAEARPGWLRSGPDRIWNLGEDTEAQCGVVDGNGGLPDCDSSCSCVCVESSVRSGKLVRYCCQLEPPVTNGCM